MHPELIDSCCPPEGVAPQEFDQTLVDTLRRAILKSLGSEYGDLKPGISPEIIRAWCLASGDPDAILAQWLVDGAPLGVEHIVRPTGVFPLDPEAEPTEEFIRGLGTGTQHWSNYQSAEEDPQKVKGILD